MADPIGISASLLTLAGTALRVGEFINQLRHCPAELIAINNEINDLRYVLSGVEAVSKDIQLEGLEPLLQRSRTIVTQVDELLAHTRTSTDRSGLSLIERVRFTVKQKEKIRRCIQQLREVRSLIDTWLATSTARTMSELRKAVGNLQLSLGSIGSEPMSRSPPNPEPGGAAESHSHPTSGQKLVTGEATALVQLSSAGANADGLLTTNVAIETQILPSCRPLCSCTCHAPSWYPSPRILSQVLGKLFIGYDGRPFWSQSCDNSQCARSSVRPVARATYYFPTWFVARAVEAAFHRGPFGDLSLAITVRGVQSSRSPVWSAIERGDIPELQDLFTRGAARPSDVDTKGETLVFYAVVNGSMATIRFLLSAGSDPYCPNDRHESAFDYAWTLIIGNSRLSSITKADLRHVFGDIRMLDCWQLTRIHRIVLGLIPHNLREELELSTAEINTPDSQNRTPLWWAATVLDAVAVETLLEFGANPDIADCRGTPPLSMSMAFNNMDIYLRLLGANANPNWKTLDGFQVTHWVILSELDLKFLDAAWNPLMNVDARVSHGHTPLRLAVRQDSPSKVKWLVEHGADVDKRITSRSNYTPLMEAVKLNHHACIRELLQAGADLTLFSCDKGAKGTVWGLAVYYGSVNTLDELAAAAIGQYFDPSQCIKDGSAWEVAVRYRGFDAGERASLLRMCNTSDCRRCVLDAQAGVSAAISLGLYDLQSSAVANTTTHDGEEFYEAEETPHHERGMVPHTHREVQREWFKDDPKEGVLVADDGKLYRRDILAPGLWNEEQVAIGNVEDIREIRDKIQSQFEQALEAASDGEVSE